MNTFKTMIIILSALTVLGVVALIFVLNINDSEASGERSIDDVRKSSLVTDEITTDLKSGGFIRIKFRIVTDSEDALEELKKRDFQMKNILLKEISTLDSETFQTGLSHLEDTVELKLNEFMNEGMITDVYTVDKVLQ